MSSTTWLLRAHRAPRTARGCRWDTTDEGIVGQELSLSHEDRIIHKVSAPFTNNMQTHKTWHSRALILNPQPDLNHCCSLQCLNKLLENLCQMHKSHPNAPDVRGKVPGNVTGLWIRPQKSSCKILTSRLRNSSLL